MCLIDSVEVSEPVGIDDRSHRVVDSDRELVAEFVLGSADVERVAVESMPRDGDGCSRMALFAGERDVDRRRNVVCEVVSGESCREAQRCSWRPDSDLGEVVVDIDFGLEVYATCETVDLSSAAHLCQAAIGDP